MHVRQHAPALCRNWFDSLAHSGLSGGVATIVAETSSQRDYLETRCADAFDDALRSVTGRLVTARFMAEDDRPSNPAPKPTDRQSATTGGRARRRRTDLERAENSRQGAGRRREPALLALPENEWADGALERPPVEHAARSAAARNYRHGTLPLSPDYAFEHFVVGPGNRIAHAAAKAVADNPGKAYNPLFIHGDVGLGKTHLLQAVCLDLVEHKPGLRIFYTSCEHFTSRYIELVKAGRMDEFHQLFREVDVLVIDDIHFLSKRERTQDEFFHTFNALYQADKQLVISSDAAPEDIPDLESRLVSRFKWGLVTTVVPPTFETRIEIIKEKARMRDLAIDDETAQLIAGREQENIRVLEGDLTKLQLHASIAGSRTVDPAMARQALGEPLARAAAVITVDQIIRQVTEYFGVRTTDLQSRKRSRSIALPRQFGMYLARTLTTHSLEEIGGYFGGRDHTTVMHAIRKITNGMAEDETTRATVRDLRTRLGVAAEPRPPQPHRPQQDAEHDRPAAAEPKPASASPRGRDAGLEPAAQPTARSRAAAPARTKPDRPGS